MSKVYGVRPWDISFIKQANNDDGKPQLRIIKGKTYNNRAGIKEETEPSWLEPAAVNGTTFDLVQNRDRLSLPPEVSDKTLSAYLRRLAYWRKLVKEYGGRGEWLRPYSFRDTFSVRVHSFNIPDTNIANPMGHTLEMHHRSYQTSEWKAGRSAFAQVN